MSTGDSFLLCQANQWQTESLDKFAGSDRPVWAVINYREKALSERIINDLELSEVHQQALVDPDIRPRLWQTKNHQVLLFIRGINLNPDSEPQNMVSLRIFFDGKRLVCFRNRKLQAISFMREQLVASQMPIDDLFARLLNEVVVRIEQQIISLANTLDNIEELSEQNQNIDVDGVESTRKIAAKLWRYIAPQQDVFRKLAQSNAPWITDQLRDQLLEIEDNITYQAEELALIRERCQMLEDRVDNQLNQKVNRNLYLISIITAIFLPISFLTGLFGINIGGMPGVDNNLSFWFFCGLLLVLALVEIIYLKKKRWF
ncbi:MAG: hypothetical protein HWE13_01555 [Gammaproteobacteria bacterium]|nr:hypothetical protein [Gammaproteobacteria bacterium]NVK86776.1 hypothetical protein [Gammaproteobacteria bacterium]